MDITTIQDIPQWAVNYIVYGDDSGITEEEKMSVDTFLDELHSNGWRIGEAPIEDSEREFNRYPAFGDDCCATVDFYVYRD